MAANQEILHKPTQQTTVEPRYGLIQRAAEYLINSRLGGIIFSCNLTLHLDEEASLCDKASPNAKNHVEEWEIMNFPMTHDHPSAIDSAVRNELGLGHIREVDGHAV